MTAVSILPYNFSNLSQLSQPGKASKPHSMNSPDSNYSELSALRLLRRLAPGNDSRIVLSERKTLSAISSLPLDSQHTFS